MPQRLSNHHQPVLMSEALSGLLIDEKRDGIFIDATFGRGGHSTAIMDQLASAGKLYAIDQDPDAIQYAAAHFKYYHDARFTLWQASFTQLATLVAAEKITGEVDGILLDVGVSSPQLDNPARGFSFRNDGPLDMRMNPAEGISAAELLKTIKEETLREMIKIYGEERYARKIARGIIAARDSGSVTTTKQLADIIATAHPAWERDKHPATQTFQALRIYLNQELEALESVLPQCLAALKTGGRLAVISFHSLEDRIVKRFMQRQAHGDTELKKLAWHEPHHQPAVRCIARKVRASSLEITHNPRARSAVLRIMEKL